MTGRPRPFLDELKRRHVLRAAGVYVVAGFGAIQAAELLFPRLAVPDWGVSLVIGLALAGFPLALGFAWAYDVTAGGLQRTPPRARRARSREPVQPAPVAVAPAGTGTATVADGRRSVAVLPFANLSADPENGFFCDGITEDILTHLSRVAELRVTSRTSVMRYKGTMKTLGEIAAELGVDHVLEGSVRIGRDRVRVAAQLIDARSDAHLWAETYDRSLDDVFAVQSEVAEAVARALQAKLTRDELKSIHSHATENVQAYGLWRRAMVGFDSWLPRDLDFGISCCEAALRIDPDYARAHATLGMLLAVYPAFAGRAPDRYQERMAHAAARALELDDLLVEAHVAQAFTHWTQRWDWLAAEQEIQVAQRLGSDNPAVLTSIAFYFVMLGRFREGEAVLATAFALHPNLFGAHTIQAMIDYYRAGWQEGEADFRPALRRIDAMITANPENALGHIHRGFCLSIGNRPAEALESIDLALLISPLVPIAHGMRGLCLARLGRTDEALLEEAWFEEQARSGAEDPNARATLRFGLGDLDGAFELLHRAVDQRSFLLPFVRVQPRFRPLWIHPSFISLLERIWPGEQQRVLGEYGCRPAEARVSA